MPRYFAFLRGINLGNRNVKMDRLREIIEELGLDDVATYLASGNVTFVTGDDPDGPDAAGPGAGALERRLEDHLRDALGFEVATLVRTAEELRAVAEYDAFPDVDGEPGALNVVFLRESPPAEGELRVALDELETDDDRFRVMGRELWWRSETKMSSSPAWAPLTKALPDDATMRTVNTVRRLVGKFT